MSTFTTPLMNLELPISGPGGEPGPDWADDLNTALETVDSHDHSVGKGTPVPTAGININADLTMANQNLTNSRSLRMTSQSASLNSATDKNCVSVVNGDLYFNNSSGTAVQVTSGSGINAASIGGIGGDYATSTASVVYNNSTKSFVFTQNSGITAKMSVGDLSVSENASGAQPITIKSPTSLGSAYNVVLPTALPVSGSKILAIDNLGQMTASTDVDNSTLQLSGGVLSVIINSILPAGIVNAWTTSSAPSGWLLCDGSAVSRSTYATLFSAIGITHGQGNGTTTFNIPDYRGRFLRMVDGSAGVDPDKASRTAMATGGNTGNNVGSVQADAFRAHNHFVTLANPSGFGLNITGSGDSTVSTTNTSTPGGNETRPVNAYVNYIIKT